LFFLHGIRVSLDSSKSLDDKGDKEDEPQMEIQMGESPHFPELLIDLNK